jgi:UMF1 family MFS transporter
LFNLIVAIIIIIIIIIISFFFFFPVPLLARTHWDVLAKTPESVQEKGKTYSLKKHNAALDATSNTISSISSAVGYIGAVVCFACVGIIVFTLQLLPPSSGFGNTGFFDGKFGVETYAKQVGVAFAATWTIIGMYWPMKYMRDRPGTPLKAGTNYFTYSWKKVYQTLRQARKLPNTFLFLVAWFLLSDGQTTVGTVTILFAQNELGFTSTEIIILAIGAPIIAAGGNYFWLRFQRYKKWNTKQMLLLMLSLNMFVPIYGMLGFFLPFGLKIKWELLFVGAYYGSLLGAIQSYMRVMFSELLPPGQEAEFFALFAITDKGSSWFGPLIVGAITDATHNMRYSWFFLIVMLGSPIWVLWYVDMEKGKKDVLLVAEMEHGAEATAVERVE